MEEEEKEEEEKEEEVVVEVEEEESLTIQERRQQRLPLHQHLPSPLPHAPLPRYGVPGVWLRRDPSPAAWPPRNAACLRDDHVPPTHLRGCRAAYQPRASPI